MNNYDSEIDFFKDEDGKNFLINEFDQTLKTNIYITEDQWLTTWRGKSHFINWSEIELPLKI